MKTRLLSLIVLSTCGGAHADSSTCELAKGTLTQEDLDQTQAFDEGQSFMERKMQEKAEASFICQPEMLAIMNRNITAIQRETEGVNQVKAACSEDVEALRAADQFGAKLQARLDGANKVAASIRKACPSP